MTVTLRYCSLGICQYAVGGIGTGSAMEGKVPLEVVCRDLQRMIREEARTAALIGDASTSYLYLYLLFCSSLHQNYSISDFLVGIPP